jgi:hypothetical protein
MAQYSDEQVKERFDNLPNDIKTAITSVDFAKTLQFIGEENNLHYDKLDILFEEVGFVMLGFKSVKDFANTLSSRLGMQMSEILPVVKGVDELIFKPIKESLEKNVETHEEKNEYTFIDKSEEDSHLPKMKDASDGELHENNTEDEGLNRDDILKEIENPTKSNKTNVTPESTSNQNKKYPWDEVLGGGTVPRREDPVKETSPEIELPEATEPKIDSVETPEERLADKEVDIPLKTIAIDQKGNLTPQEEPKKKRSLADEARKLEEEKKFNLLRQGTQKTDTIFQKTANTNISPSIKMDSVVQSKKEIVMAKPEDTKIDTPIQVSTPKTNDPYRESVE